MCCYLVRASFAPGLVFMDKAVLLNICYRIELKRISGEDGAKEILKLLEAGEVDKLKKSKLEFVETLKEFKDVYSREMLNAFYSYWTEPNKSKTKVRWQLEKTWDVSRRLKTWADNNKEIQKQSKVESILSTNEQVKKDIDEMFK